VDGDAASFVGASLFSPGWCPQPGLKVYSLVLVGGFLCFFAPHALHPPPPPVDRLFSLLNTKENDRKF
jgi:hypothetical protein